MKEYQSPGLHRGGVLGQRVLCFDGRFGRGHGTGIHPATSAGVRAQNCRPISKLGLLGATYAIEDSFALRGS